MNKFFKFCLFFQSPRFFTTKTTQTIPSDSTLFNRLGGEDVLQKTYVVFNSKIKANHALISYFKKTPLDQINEHQKIILAVAFGKEIKYSFKEMKIYHSPHSIREGDFDILINELIETFSLMKFSEELVSEALGHIEKMRRFIIAQTLYQKMGGEEAKLKQMMGVFFEKILKDSELRHFYLNFDSQKLQESYTKYFISMFGGPHKYAGKDLKLCHQNMELTDRHFYLYKKYMSDSMRLCKYDPQIIEEAIHKMERQRTSVLNYRTPFEELGGKFGIQQIVESWFHKVLNDPLLKPIFSEIDIEKLMEKLTDFMSHDLGNNEKIAIKDLKSVHAKYNLSDFHLDSFKNWIKITLEEQNVSNDLVRDLLWILEKYRRDVCSVNIFDIIGGESTVVEITILMTQKVRAHNHLSVFFIEKNDEELKNILRSMLSYSLGGPRAFRGKDIRVCHEHLKITNRNFEEMKMILEKVLHDMGIVDSLIGQLMRVFEMRRPDVVDNS